MVLLPWDMHELHPLEVLLEFADLFQIGSYVIVLGRVAFVGEVDEELGVSFDEQMLDAERDCGPEAGKEAFVFGNVVGDLILVIKAQLHGVVELVAYWRGEDRASPRALRGELPVEVHGPVTWRWL